MEFAAAVLIVSGMVRLFAVALTVAAPPDDMSLQPAIVSGEVALQLFTIATGVVVRVGRAWLIVVNVVAVLAFIQLLSLAGVVSIAFALLFAVGVAGILGNRPWFDAMAAWRRDVATARRA